MCSDAFDLICCKLRNMIGMKKTTVIPVWMTLAFSQSQGHKKARSCAIFLLLYGVK